MLMMKCDDLERTMTAPASPQDGIVEPMNVGNKQVDYRTY
jgi:hypothetical protein